MLEKIDLSNFKKPLSISAAIISLRQIGVARFLTVSIHTPRKAFSKITAELWQLTNKTLLKLSVISV